MEAPREHGPTEQYNAEKYELAREKLRTTEREEENHELNVQGCIAGVWHQHHVCLAV